MRFLFHVRVPGPEADVHMATRLSHEGFLHTSFLDTVAESARLYFPESVRGGLEVLQIDPRRLDVPLEVVATPRGPMPHVHGAVPADAIVKVFRLAELLDSPCVDVVRGTRFGFVAFQGMTLLDLVGVYDPLSRIRSMGFDASSSCEIVGGDDGAVWAEDGARFVVNRVRPRLDEFDVVVVPGGLGSRALSKDASFVAWLRAFPSNRLVASVCTGALLLGAAGRLRGKRATTHASAIHELATFGAAPVRQRIVDEGQLVTAGGVTSALDLGLHLVRRFEGDETAAKIALQMEMTA